MKAYLQDFIKSKQNNWAELLPIVEFAYNNIKNASISYTLFELNCKYHFCIFYKKNFYPHSKSKTTEELFFKLWKLITNCQQNFYHAQEL